MNIKEPTKPVSDEVHEETCAKALAYFAGQITLQDFRAVANQSKEHLRACVQLQALMTMTKAMTPKQQAKLIRLEKLRATPATNQTEYVARASSAFHRRGKSKEEATILARILWRLGGGKPQLPEQDVATFLEGAREDEAMRKHKRKRK